MKAWQSGYLNAVTVVERAIKQIVVVVPAHNEVANLPGCIESLQAAAAVVPVPALTVVVLDHCDDGSEDLFAHFSAINMNGFKTLKEGEKVSFEVVQGPKGKQASNIQAA